MQLPMNHRDKTVIHIVGKLFAHSYFVKNKKKLELGVQRRKSLQKIEILISDDVPSYEQLSQNMILVIFFFLGANDPV